MTTSKYEDHFQGVDGDGQKCRQEADEYDHRIKIIDTRFEKDFTMAGHKS
jgi:hypothetical protein